MPHEPASPNQPFSREAVFRFVFNDVSPFSWVVHVKAYQAVKRVWGKYGRGFMSKSVSIYFLTWPDGKMFERTQNSISERHAWAAAIHSWLPHDWFPGLNLIQSYSAFSELRNAMTSAGFKCHEIDVDAAIANGVSL